MTDLDCRNFVELVSWYVDGELDDATTGRVILHRSACPACERYAHQLEQTIRLVRSMQRPSGPRATR